MKFSARDQSQCYLGPSSKHYLISLICGHFGERHSVPNSTGGARNAAQEVIIPPLFLGQAERCSGSRRCIGSIRYAGVMLSVTAPFIAHLERTGFRSSLHHFLAGGLGQSSLNFLKPPFLICKSGRIILASCTCLEGFMRSNRYQHQTLCPMLDTQVGASCPRHLPFQFILCKTCQVHLPTADLQLCHISAQKPSMAF